MCIPDVNIDYTWEAIPGDDNANSLILQQTSQKLKLVLKGTSLLDYCFVAQIDCYFLLRSVTCVME